jgi:hypothetical protein
MSGTGLIVFRIDSQGCGYQGEVKSLGTRHSWEDPRAKEESRLQRNRTSIVRGRFMAGVGVGEARFNPTRISQSLSLRVSKSGCQDRTEHCHKVHTDSTACSQVTGTFLG